jgi:hypothetical protein
MRISNMNSMNHTHGNTNISRNSLMQQMGNALMMATHQTEVSFGMQNLILQVAVYYAETISSGVSDKQNSYLNFRSIL